MATIIFTIEDEKVQEVVDALNNTLAPRTIEEKALSPGAWAKEVIKRWLIRQVKNYRTNIAVAEIQNQTDIDSAIN